jgi:hypothetical protein
MKDQDSETTSTTVSTKVGDPMIDFDSPTPTSTMVRDPIIDFDAAKDACKLAISKYDVTSMEGEQVAVEVSSQSMSSSPMSSSPLERSPSSSLNNRENKCAKCKTRLCREGCTQSACLICCDDLINCEAHKKPRLQATFKAQVMEGSHFIQQEVARIRSLRIPPSSRRSLHIREPNILYQGDTVVIWDIRAYARNSKWKDDATRRSLKRRYVITPPSALTSGNDSNENRRKRAALSNSQTNEGVPRNVLRNNRKRFRHICDELYRTSTGSSVKKTDTINS